MRHYAQHAGVCGCRRGAVRFRHAAGAPGHAAAVRLGTGVLHSLAHHRAAIGRYYDPGLAGTATGFITGFATLFDVAFNACFGKLIDWLGFGTAIQILPVSMLLLCLSFFLLRIRVPKSKEIL